jgi:hypothetical protein
LVVVLVVVALTVVVAAVEVEVGRIVVVASQPPLVGRCYLFQPKMLMPLAAS